MTDIKPIETRYAGCRFRSRMEARYAVFFDALGIDWQYEPEGFTLSDGTRYLPDFYLPAQNQWAEVKATLRMPDLRRIVRAAHDLRPNEASPHTFHPGLLILGPIPKPTRHLVHTRYTSLGNLVIEQRCFFAPCQPPAGIQLRGVGEHVALDEDSIDWSDSDPESADFLCESAVSPCEDDDIALHQPVVDAYRAARSARFEHGESG